MNKEQPDLFPRAEKPEKEMNDEPEVPPEESARIQAERTRRHGLKKEVPREFAKLKAKLGLDEPPGPLFENKERQN